MKVFITSDTHFGHKNIIKYENRPFADADTMNEELIKAWNETVSNDDVVYHLGDFAPFKKKQYIQELRQRLKGKIFLIMGNHDREIGTAMNFRELGFNEVFDRPVLLENFIILSHEPLYIPNNDSTPYRWIFGHVHGNPSVQTLSEVSACACVERWNYKPVELNEIIREWEVLNGK